MGQSIGLGTYNGTLPWHVGKLASKMAPSDVALMLILTPLCSLFPTLLVGLSCGTQRA